MMKIIDYLIFIVLDVYVITFINNVTSLLFLTFSDCLYKNKFAVGFYQVSLNELTRKAYFLFLLFFLKKIKS